MESFARRTHVLYHFCLMACVACADDPWNPYPIRGPHNLHFSIRDFGAVGDNKTVDTAAVQHAINAAAKEVTANMVIVYTPMSSITHIKHNTTSRQTFPHYWCLFPPKRFALWKTAQRMCGSRLEHSWSGLWIWAQTSTWCLRRTESCKARTTQKIMPMTGSSGMWFRYVR